MNLKHAREAIRALSCLEFGNILYFEVVDPSQKVVIFFIIS